MQYGLNLLSQLSIICPIVNKNIIDELSSLAL